MHKPSLSFAVVATLIIMVKAANHTVGAPNGGWDQFTDLQTWASSNTFSSGDNLFFQYGPSHNILEVSKADYDSCATGNPLNPPYTGGSTAVPLTNPGKRYFICGVPGHCAAGMKVEINTKALLTSPVDPLPPSSPSPLADHDPAVSSPWPSPVPLQWLSPNALPWATAHHPVVPFPDTAALSSGSNIGIVVDFRLVVSITVTMLMF